MRNSCLGLLVKVKTILAEFRKTLGKAKVILCVVSCDFVDRTFPVG